MEHSLDPPEKTEAPVTTVEPIDILAVQEPETASMILDLPPIEDFSAMGLAEVIHQAIAHMGWSQPTLTQARCLPYVLRGLDVAGFAQTGTGKTGVFLIGLAQKLYQENLKNAHIQGFVTTAPRAVILCPTRELVIQIEEEAQSLFKHLSLKVLAVYGGTGFEEQNKHLVDGVDVIVATPGRLKDFYQRKAVAFSHIHTFICDEVDRMCDMGFREEVEYFLEQLPENTQTLIFSATTSDRVTELAFEYLTNPQYLFIHSDEVAPENIEQHALLCETPQKFKVLLGLLNQHNPERAVIFTNTKLVAAWLHYKLSKNHVRCDLITGDLPQLKRTRLIKAVKAGQVRVLIATDVASRGLHISGVTHVYNFDLPDEGANYVHRIGRTARAGAKGQSYSLLCDEYGENYAKIKDILGDITPKPEWPSEDLLTTKDISDNPFVTAIMDEPHFTPRADRYEKPRTYERPYTPPQTTSDPPVVITPKGDIRPPQPTATPAQPAKKLVITYADERRRQQAATQAAQPGLFAWMTRVFKKLLSCLGIPTTQKAPEPKAQKMIYKSKDRSQHAEPKHPLDKDERPTSKDSTPRSSYAQGPRPARSPGPESEGNHHRHTSHAPHKPRRQEGSRPNHRGGSDPR